MKKEIIPWKCHCCEKCFDNTAGGIWKKCGKPTCNNCFSKGKVRRLTQLKLPESRVCPACSKE